MLGLPRGRSRQSRTAAGTCGEASGRSLEWWPGAFYCCLVSRSSSRRSSSGSLHSAESRAISWSRCRSCSTSTASRVAFSVCCTSSSATLGVFKFTSPFWTPPWWRRFAGPGPFGLGLSRIIAADFAAVNPLATVPQSPFRGTWGIIFAQNFRAFFVENGESGNFCGGVAGGISSEFLPGVGGL